MKSKAPTYRPQEISGFLKFLSFLRAQMSCPHMARILELLQHYLETFLNFENSFGFENLFKTKARQPATVVNKFSRESPKFQTGFHVSKRRSCHPKKWTRKPSNLDIQIFEV